MAKQKKKGKLVNFCDHPECKNETVWECLHIAFNKKRNVRMCDLHAIELMFKLRDSRIEMYQSVIEEGARQAKKDSSPIKTLG
jgi:hypothetical protein